MAILCTYDFTKRRLRYAFSRETYTADQLNAEHFSKTKANRLITSLSGGRAFYRAVPDDVDDTLGVVMTVRDLVFEHDATVLICLPPTGWGAINSEAFA